MINLNLNRNSSHTDFNRQLSPSRQVEDRIDGKNDRVFRVSSYSDIKPYENQGSTNLKYLLMEIFINSFVIY